MSQTLIQSNLSVQIMDRFNIKQVDFAKLANEEISANIQKYDFNEDLSKVHHQLKIEIYEYLKSENKIASVEGIYYYMSDIIKAKKMLMEK